MKISDLINLLSEFLIKFRARAVARRVNQAINFPIRANTVQRVLVILPRNLELLEKASDFVQSLRKTYPGWRVELFDVDKLSKSELNPIRLPRQEVLQKLKKADYHFVVDLNASVDPLSAFIALMTEAKYRLQLQADGSLYYNIVYQPQKSDNGIYYDSLLKYLRKLFVKN